MTPATDRAATVPPAAALPAASPRAAGKPSPARYPRPGAGEGTKTPAGARRNAVACAPAGSSSPGKASPAVPGGVPEPGCGGHAPLRPGQGEPRTWTIEMPAGLPLLSLNGREHWAARNRKTQTLKDAAIVMARQAKIPPLERVSIVAEYQPPDRRHRDPDNIAISVKAVIDGCRIAQVIPQDDSRYVAEVTCRIGEAYPKGRLILHLTEVAETGGAA